MKQQDEDQEADRQISEVAPDKQAPVEDASAATDSPSVSTAADNDQPGGQPEEAVPLAAEEKPPTHGLRFKQLPARYWAHKRWSLPLTLIIVLAAVMAIPVSRYAVLGLFIKEDTSVTVLDTTTNMPVSRAVVSFGSESAITASSGKASLKLPVGDRTLTITKQYYKTAASSVMVSLTSSRNTFLLHLTATGRQVPIAVTDKISGKPVANAELKVLDVSVKTDNNGKAIIVLPTGVSVQSGTLSANGYNSAAVKVQITSQTVAANSYNLTPSGYIYFLSNLSGKIDVVKTHLDGTGRQTVLAGTGHEHPENTVLLASRDWKYLALWAQRQPTGDPEIDLIDTSTDKMTNIDEGNAQFTLVGWDGDRFVYQVYRNAVQAWQNGQQVLKSFNAPTGKLTVLAQTTATGSTSYDYIRQTLGDAYIIGDKVIYSIGWDAGSYLWNQSNSKQAALMSVNADGTGSTTIKSFGVPAGSQVSYINMSVVPYDKPNSLAIDIFDTYYEYQNGTVSKSSDLTRDSFYNGNYATYLESPSGNQVFWSKPTDGKNTLFVSDSTGDTPNKIATLSDFTTYGWYTDKYLLVAKNGSELYIMPYGGGSAIKISDYFKPSQFAIRGYGGGYGGL